jgi:hypothetical protein
MAVSVGAHVPGGAASGTAATTAASTGAIAASVAAGIGGASPGALAGLEHPAVTAITSHRHLVDPISPPARRRARGR